MKRSLALQELSREHHAALSLASRIARADEQAQQDMAATIAERFRREIAPHFDREESDLLVRLAAAGEAALVQQTLAEHRQLRDLAARLSDGDHGVVARFGVALRDHVRFEERVLFPRVEAILHGR